MIVGRVTANRQPIIKLSVYGRDGRKHKVEAIVDTGFNGHLTLPSAVIEMLELSWRRRGRAMLADGSDVLFNIYEGTVLWNRAKKRISVDEAETVPLIGMALLDGFVLNVEVRRKGRVTIAPLAR
jgi:clan AA aspartic protease